ncbi:MAG: hypothetical protein J7L45_03440 [Candidatus Aenigmarchaeota archaeon]|nr:hypothetical protein [Candidatus Aenigmarchaeota archaeon]
MCRYARESLEIIQTRGGLGTAKRKILELSEYCKLCEEKPRSCGEFQSVIEEYLDNFFRN